MGSCEGAKLSAGAKHEPHANSSMYDLGDVSAAARSSSETKRSGAVSRKTIGDYVGRKASPRWRMGDCEGAERSAGAKHELHGKPSIYDFGYLSAAARSPSETKRSGAVSKEILWFLVWMPT